MKTQYFPEVGEGVYVELPYSEACMFMRVAGKVMIAELVACREGRHHMVQLFDLNGQEFSFPITCGEAGFYHDGDRIYCYPVEPPEE